MMWPFKKRTHEPVQVLDRKTVRFTFEGDYTCGLCTTDIHVTDRMEVKKSNQYPYPDWWYVTCPSCGYAIEVHRTKIVEPQEGEE